MKRVMTIAIGMTGVMISAAALANMPAAGHVPAASTDSAKTDMVLLYAQANKTQLVKKLAPNVRLVPIFQKGDWLKVGDAQTGTVGWVNLVQYQQARMNYYRPDIQTIYVHLDTHKAGKPTLNIVAYKNGKRMTDAKAYRLYKQLREQQNEELQTMQQFSLSMDRMMQQDFGNAERFFGSAWINPSWMAPVILVPSPAAAKKASPKQS